MIIDYNLMMSDAQDETTVAAHVSDNVIDLTQTTLRAPGKDLWVVVKVNTACTSGGSATVQAKLVCSAAAALTSATTLKDSGAIAVASLVKDYVFFAIRLPDVIPLRYLGVTYTIGTAVLTAGKFDAFITTEYPIPEIK